MRNISELHNIHKNSDIYIIGTGTSLSFFPKDFLKNKILIGLNMAWKIIPDLNYSITIHPALNIDFNKEYPSKLVTWIIKKDKLSELSGEQLKQIKKLIAFNTIENPNSINPPNEPKSSSRDLNLIRQNQVSYLYQWSSISATALHLAYIMGAKNIFLVGCDCAPLNGSDHAIPQHTRWKGASPKHRYFQYKEALVEVRDRLHQLDVNVINLSPFIGINEYEWEARKLASVRGIDIGKSLGDLDPLTIKDWIKWVKIKTFTWLVKYKK